MSLSQNKMKITHASTDRVAFEGQVKTQNFYEKGWTHILTPIKNSALLVEFSKTLAENKFIGYSQEKRKTLYDFLKNHSLNELKTKVFCDCSSFVETCLIQCGIVEMYRGITTRTMLDLLKEVVIVKDYDKNILADGDIVLKVGSHCGIVSETGKQTTDIAESKKVVRVIANSLRVRDVPNGKHIKSVFNGDRLTILDRDGKWYKIQFRDIVGWVHSDYVKEV